jgi:hypothetical protein
MRAAAFILSDVRSGSTLLDQCLGAHTDIVTLGEAHWLPVYVTLDRSWYNPAHELVCVCGKPVPECEFWSAVRQRIGRPFESLSLHSGFNRAARTGDLGGRINFLLRRFVRSNPGLYRLAFVQRLLSAKSLAADIVSLFEAASWATGRSVCIDSSKSPFRFRAVYCLDPAKTKAIVLARDFRAVVHSKMKRGESLEAAARGWRVAMEQIDALTRDLPTNRVHRVRYETLCQNPRSELERLCAFLGIGFQEAMLRRPAVGSVHHIGGSPSKFDASRTEISLDQSYVGAFSDQEVSQMRRLVGVEAARWFY